MTPERWGQLEELYEAARALPPSERTALLERADPELRAAVASILAQEAVLEKGDGAFLDRPAWEGLDSLPKDDDRPSGMEQEIKHVGMPTAEMSMMGGPAPAQ